MFEIGWSELLVIAIVAIVVIGPKDLPRVMRAVGQWAGKMKRMSREFQNQFNEALREAELEDVRKDVQEIGQGLREHLNKTSDEIKTGFDVQAPAAPPAPLPGPPPAAAGTDEVVAQSSPAASVSTEATRATEPGVGPADSAPAEVKP